MRDPGSVVAGADFAQFILPNFFYGLLVSYWIILNGHLRRHPTHGMDSASVADLDQQLDVSIQESPVHRNLCAIGKNEPRMIAKFLDEAEDVIPAPAVESGGVVAQL